jgi:hypothetical protein
MTLTITRGDLIRATLKKLAEKPPAQPPPPPADDQAAAK